MIRISSTSPVRSSSPTSSRTNAQASATGASASARKRLQRASRMRDPQALGQQNIQLFAEPLSKAHRIRWQNQYQRGPKLYSWHAPEVECIGKGKAQKPYEFGAKSRSPPPTAAARAASSCFTPTRSPAIPTTVTPSRRRSRTPKGSPDSPSSAPMSTRDTAATAHAAATTHLHLRPEAWRPRGDQARTQAMLSH